MSEVDRDEMTVSTDGVTVRKSLDDDQFETLAIVFEVRSDRDELVRLRLTDQIPDGIKLEDVGFHPDYGAEYWEAKDDYVVFEREFSAVEDFTTIYGVREYDDEILDSFLADPEVELIDQMSAANEPELDIDLGDPEEEADDETMEVVSAEDSQAVREVIAGERDTLPGLEEGAKDTLLGGSDEPLLGEAATDDEPDVDMDAEVDDEPEPVDLDATDPATEQPDGAEPDPMTEPMNDIEAASREVLSNNEPTDTESTHPDDDETEAGDEITVPVTGGVVRVLVKELQEGSVDPESKRLLRDELMPGDTSTDARIKRLQNEVSDLVAYTDALEAFIDENGTGQQLVDDLTEQIDSLTDSVDSLEERLDRTGSEVSSIEESVNALESDVESLRAEQAAMGELEQTIDSVEAELADVQNDIEALTSFRDRLSSAFGGQMGGED